MVIFSRVYIFSNLRKWAISQQYSNSRFRISELSSHCSYFRGFLGNVNYTKMLGCQDAHTLWYHVTVCLSVRFVQCNAMLSYVHRPRLMCMLRQTPCSSTFAETRVRLPPTLHRQSMKRTGL